MTLANPPSCVGRGGKARMMLWMSAGTLRDGIRVTFCVKRAGDISKTRAAILAHFTDAAERAAADKLLTVEIA